MRHWTVGDRVEVGWFGGHCGHCPPCREGDFIDCRNLQVPGWAYEGGYATHMVAPVNALARIPDGLTAVDAAPSAAPASPRTTPSRRAPPGPATSSR